MCFLALLLGSVLLQNLHVAAQFGNGNLRLVGGSYQWEGRVEMFFNRSWGTITDSDWTSEDAQAVCRTLGYFRPGASGYTGAYFGQGKGPIHFDHIVCSGMEYNLTECETGKATRQSSHDEDVGVKCNTIDNNYKSGDIRLVGGPTNWEGRVEIFWKGEWGTISTGDWDTEEAQIVCKQLGLPSKVPADAGPVPCCSRYGNGTGLIHITALDCLGSEEYIIECKYNAFPITNHEHDVGVMCGQGPDFQSGDIRLVGGSYNWEGRVEIYLNGQWGTISYGNTDSLDAFVVCRQLGYDTRSGYTDISHDSYRDFGMGSGPIHLNYLRCYGNEYRLMECQSQSSSWQHYSDWGVTCRNDNPEEGDILLYYNARSSDHYQGLLHVWLNGQWGTVSPDLWTDENLNIACRQIGRDGVESYSSFYNYYDDLPTIMSNVTCVGTESRLIDCYYAEVDTYEYYHPVSLECTNEDPCTYGDTRLTGGSTELEGRVEMCNSRSMWGTVCGNEWTEAQSRVVCSSLGFSDEEESSEMSEKFDKENDLPIAVDYVKCQGSENLLKNCVHFSHSFSGCSHGDDVGVRCQPANCENGEVRFLEEDKIDGLVLVCNNRRWNTFCDSQTEANVHTVCTQMGYRDGYLRYYYYESLPGVPAYISSLSCYGEETRVFDCAYDKSNSSQVCSDPLKLWCISAYCTDGQVRLVDGDTEVEGRVEICFSRRWGTISGDGWTETESTVVCNDLGYEATGMEYSVRPATNSMPLHTKSVRCTGKEMSLLECSYRKNDTHNNHFEDIGVQCKKPDCVDGDLKLLSGSSNKDGALEVCLDQRWGTISGDGWTAVDTLVACRQLGFNSTGRHYKTTATYALSTPIYMDNVGCHGTEAKLIDCAYHRDTSEDRHSGDIWIECDKLDSEGKMDTEEKNDNPKSDGVQTEQKIVSEKGSDVGLSVALVALIISIVVTIALVGLLIYKKRHGCIRERINFYYQKSAKRKEDETPIVSNIVLEPQILEDPPEK